MGAAVSGGGAGIKSLESPSGPGWGEEFGAFPLDAVRGSARLISTCLFCMLTKWSATASEQAVSSAKERKPKPRLFFFSWSYIMTTSTTSP